MEKCSKCDMPLDEKTTCGCNEKVCKHCCECPEDCKCGCKKADEGEKKE